MYEILEDEKNQSKKRNYRIYKNPEKVYDEYFCHGIEGRDELLEGIIFFSHNSEIARIQKTKYNKAIRNKSELERTIERAIEIYLQFYRFVDLNDRDKVPHYYHLENERELRKNIEMQIRNKLIKLENSNDDYMFISNQERSQNPQRYDEDGEKWYERLKRTKEEKEVERLAQKENKLYQKKLESSFSVGYDNIVAILENLEIDPENREQLKGLIDEQLKDIIKKQTGDGRIKRQVGEKYFNTKKIRIEDNRILYSAREKLRYAHFPEGSNPDNVQPYIIRHWTENVYDILSYLNNLEKSDKMKYYRIWLHTRIARLKNRGHIDDAVREEIELLTKQGEKVKTLQKRKEERKKKMEEIHKANQEEER